MDIQHGTGLSPWGRAPDEEPSKRTPQRRSALLATVRYAMPAAVFVAGIVIIAVEPDRATALEAGFMFFGVAIAIVLLNLFFRIGMRGEIQQDREEAAREYFDRHGRWPDP